MLSSSYVGYCSLLARYNVWRNDLRWIAYKNCPVSQRCMSHPIYCFTCSCNSSTMELTVYKYTFHALGGLTYLLCCMRTIIWLFWFFSKYCNLWWYQWSAWLHLTLFVEDYIDQLILELMLNIHRYSLSFFTIWNLCNGIIFVFSGL